jgi:hypothetical protein
MHQGTAQDGSCTASGSCSSCRDLGQSPAFLTHNLLFSPEGKGITFLGKELYISTRSTHNTNLISFYSRLHVSAQSRAIIST